MKLTKRTTLLFDSDVWKQLGQVAKAEHTSVAHLVRKAVIERYLLSDRERRLAAVEAMRRMNCPVGDWQTIEREVLEGRLGRRRRPR